MYKDHYITYEKERWNRIGAGDFNEVYCSPDKTRVFKIPKKWEKNTKLHLLNNSERAVRIWAEINNSKFPAQLAVTDDGQRGWIAPYYEADNQPHDERLYLWYIKTFKKTPRHIVDLLVTDNVIEVQGEIILIDVDVAIKLHRPSVASNMALTNKDLEERFKELWEEYRESYPKTVAVQEGLYHLDKSLNPDEIEDRHINYAVITAVTLVVQNDIKLTKPMLDIMTLASENEIELSVPTLKAIALASENEIELSVPTLKAIALASENNVLLTTNRLKAIDVATNQFRGGSISQENIKYLSKNRSGEFLLNQYIMNRNSEGKFTNGWCYLFGQNKHKKSIKVNAANIMLKVITGKSDIRRFTQDEIKAIEQKGSNLNTVFKALTLNDNDQSIHSKIKEDKAYNKATEYRDWDNSKSYLCSLA